MSKDAVTWAQPEPLYKRATNKPADISEEAWDAARIYVVFSADHSLDLIQYELVARAIMAAKLEAYQEAAAHLEKRGEMLYVDYNDKVGDYLCTDLANEIRKLGEGK